MQLIYPYDKQIFNKQIVNDVSFVFLKSFSSPSHPSLDTLEDGSIFDQSHLIFCDTRLRPFKLISPYVKQATFIEMITLVD
jgi:hypothetical protein